MAHWAARRMEDDAHSMPCRRTFALVVGSAAKILSVTLAAALVGACSARYALPTITADEMAAARRSIAITSPLVSNGRSTQASAVMLASIVQRMTAAAQPLCAAYRHAPCQFQVALDSSMVPRAEAYGQERITVSAGMMNILDNEDEIAAVLGHEFGHHLAGHSGHRVARSMAAGTAAAAVLGAVVPFGGLAAWMLGQGAAELGASAARLTFSKEEEREADYLDAYLVARAGYDLDRAGRLWVKLAQNRPQENAGPLDSHPAGPERLAAWQQTSTEIRASSDLVPRQRGF
jgi:Zn-dependent protease with chaperone function